MLFRSKATIGLDIGSSLVKAIQLKRTGRGIELEKLGMADIYPSGIRPSDPAEDRRMRTDAVRMALASAGITAKQSITSISGESIIVRYIQLPDMPEAELKNALQWEAEEFIPFRIEDVNLDSVILGRTADSEGGKVDVMLVSAKKELVDQHLEIVREAGLTPIVIDVDSFAFLNCFDYNHQPGPGEIVALVNIGSGITNINIYVEGASRFSRDISIAGQTITTAIQSRLGVDHAEAEEIKRREGAPDLEARPASGMPEDSSLIDTIRGAVEQISGHAIGDSAPEAIAGKAIRNTLANLVGEIQRSIHFFENQSGGKAVQKIVLGGGTSRLPGIDRFFEHEMRLPVELINPLLRIDVGGSGVDPALLDKSREMLGVGVGLALRGVME
ncbi:MAG: cell division protein FtsA [candidate division BRC1 bacterium ADurb.BinA364]|nr:MAG: cell division protein FtsA [candidate division BRC1 bacterium ADurb.BinA364]